MPGPDHKEKEICEKLGVPSVEYLRRLDPLIIEQALRLYDKDDARRRLKQKIAERKKK